MFLNLITSPLDEPIFRPTTHYKIYSVKLSMLWIFMQYIIMLKLHIFAGLIIAKICATPVMRTEKMFLCSLAFVVSVCARGVCCVGGCGGRVARMVSDHIVSKSGIYSFADAVYPIVL